MKKKSIHPVAFLRRACDKLGIKSQIVDPSLLSVEIAGSMQSFFLKGRRFDVDDYCFILRRPEYSNPELLFYRINVIRTLEMSGLTVVNSIEAFLNAVDKFRTSVLLSMNNIKTPETLVTERGVDAMRYFEKVGKAVVKPVFGSQGKGMLLIDQKDSAWRAFKLQKYYEVPIYIQRFVEHGNRDIRVLVLGDRVLSAMYRVSKGWKTNIAMGAKPVKAKLSEEIRELALKASRIVGAEVAGVDIVETPDGLMVLEVNACPEWTGLQQVTDFDIAEEIVKYVVSKAKS